MSKIEVGAIGKSPEMKEKKREEVFITGLRPTSEDLHVGNYLGAMRDVVGLQKEGRPFFVFVADLHAMTTHKPAEAYKNTQSILINYLAAGVNSELCYFYVQSSFTDRILRLEMLLSSFFSVVEAMRVPTLKDKIDDPKKANLLLLRYPTLMAADILGMRAKKVPIGEDQVAHIEVSRLLARRFNKEYGNVFPLPEAFATKPLRLPSLDTKGKMSKSNPRGAVFLTDSKADIERKIGKAVTEVLEGKPKKMSSQVAGLFTMGRELKPSLEEVRMLAQMEKEYWQGGLQFSQLKNVVAEVVVRFVGEFQLEKEKWEKEPEQVEKMLKKGTEVARTRIDETMELVYEAIGTSLGSSW